MYYFFFFFFQAEDGIRDHCVTGVQTCALPILGTNRATAWGQVALHGSVSDLFEETLDPSDPGRYERGGHWHDATVRREEIAVRGAAPEAIEVVVTEHGPLLRSVRPDDPRANALALRWAGAANDSGVEAALRLQRCGDWECFRAALRELRAPAATFLYADANAIGTQVAGDLPIRAIDTGLLPVSGSSRFYDWRGMIPFDELPTSFGAGLGPQVVSTHVDPDALHHAVSWLWSS